MATGLKLYLKDNERYKNAERNKKMNKRMLLSALLAVVIVFTGCGAEKREVPEWIQSESIVQVPEMSEITLPDSEALDFVESMQLGWNLGNTFDAVNCGADNDLDYESAWCGILTTREMIAKVAEAGFKTLRLPVSWHNHMDADYTINEEWLDRVQEVVDWALEEDMYVILNIHHDNEEDFMYPSYDKLEQSKKYVTRVWEQLAERFEKYNENLIFETLNEPRQPGTDHEWWINVNSDLGKECMDCINQLNQAAVDAIRGNGSKYNTSRYIMVPGYCASADFVLADGFTLPDDANASKENRILVSVHAYTPYFFALAGESEANSTDYFSIEAKKGTGDIDSFMKKLYDKFISNGIGVVIGEFGSRNKQNNLDSRIEHAAYYVAVARHYGMTTCWWDNNAFTGEGENFGLLRRRQNEFLFPQIVAQMVHYSKAE